MKEEKTAGETNLDGIVYDRVLDKGGTKTEAVRFWAIMLPISGLDLEKVLEEEFPGSIMADLTFNVGHLSLDITSKTTKDP